MSKRLVYISMLNESPGGGGGERGGVLNGVRPEVQPLSLSYTFLT